MKGTELLPDQISYLQPFVRTLSKLAPEALNEDVDSSRLERVLRKRVRGLGVAQATRQLDQDRRVLDAWLKSSAPSGHPAHWILGLLTRPGPLARELLKHEPEKPRGPLITFEPPTGWRVKAIPFNLNLRKGNLTACISAIEEPSFRVLKLPGTRSLAPGATGSVVEHDVQFGESIGKKCVQLVTAPVPWKAVYYALAVPGGFVYVTLARTDGRNFDELSLEAQLHTLRLAGTA